MRKTIGIICVIGFALFIINVALSQSPQTETQQLKADLTEAQVLLGRYIIHIAKMEKVVEQHKTGFQKSLDYIVELKAAKTIAARDSVIIKYEG